MQAFGSGFSSGFANTNFLTYDHTAIAEPRLLIPGKKPAGPVRIDRSHWFGASVNTCFAFSNGIVDIANNEPVSKINGPVVERASLQLQASQNQYVDFGTSLRIERTQPWAVLARVNLASFPTDFPVLLNLKTEDEAWRLVITNNGAYDRIAFGSSGSTYIKRRFGTDQYPSSSDILGQDVTFCINYIGSSILDATLPESHRVSLNGFESPMASTGGYSGNSDPNQIGMTLGFYWDGSIDLLAIARVSLSQEAMNDLTNDPFQFLLPAA